MQTVDSESPLKEFSPGYTLGEGNKFREATRLYSRLDLAPRFSLWYEMKCWSEHHSPQFRYLACESIYCKQTFDLPYPVQGDISALAVAVYAYFLTVLL